MVQDDAAVLPDRPQERDNLVGERGFRDFSRVPPAKENRNQPADLIRFLISQVTTLTILQPEGKGFAMPTDTEKNAELEKVLKNVINVLQDGQKGFADIGEHLKDETLKRYFLAESLKRANFRAELENELHRHGVHDVHEDGTAAGALHRTWGDIKAKLMGVNDHELLATAEQGEDKAKATYKDALEQELPLPVRQLLSEQNAHIVNSHNFVRDHRDALASK